MTKVDLSPEAQALLQWIHDGDELRVVTGPQWGRVYVGGQLASNRLKGVFFGQLHRSRSDALTPLAEYRYPEGQFTQAEGELETVYGVSLDVAAWL